MENRGLLTNFDETVINLLISIERLDYAINKKSKTLASFEKVKNGGEALAVKMQATLESSLRNISANILKGGNKVSRQDPRKLGGQYPMVEMHREVIEAEAKLKEYDTLEGHREKLVRLLEKKEEALQQLRSQFVAAKGILEAAGKRLS